MDAQNGSSYTNIGTGRGQKAVGEQDDAVLGEKLWLGGVKVTGKDVLQGLACWLQAFGPRERKPKGS
jgi:hypothetical protein